uniref:Glutathione S-transferase 3, mitochondrial n=1 Tax=Monopterus albus TaxID=43700 RepID=A0A3Q3JLP3_MONAL
MNVLTVLPSNFGYVIFTYLYSWIMLMYLGIKVGAARKKYDVKYPTMYSDKEQVFNCIQRAHQNTLEVYPQWLVFQTIAALVYPLSASVLGAIWVTSRFSYAWGYYTGGKTIYCIERLNKWQTHLNSVYLFFFVLHALYTSF